MKPRMTLKAADDAKALGRGFHTTPPHPGAGSSWAGSRDLDPVVLLPAPCSLLPVEIKQ